MTATDVEKSSRLLKLVESIAITPDDAKKIVNQYKKSVLAANPKLQELEIQKIVAKKIVSRYSSYSSISGGVTSLSSIIPGVGTAVAVTGGAIADTSYCMKNQVDMCMCLAEAFNWDISSEDARQLSFLIAAGGTLEKLGSETVVKIASNAGVKMLKMYLKGPALIVIKEMFKKIGINFSRKALEKSLPFGVGVVISSSANYMLAKYVGNVATKWFTIEQESRNNDLATTDKNI
ncbi:hypothetical protein CAG37_023500 [Serratia nematodiphila]|nr:hypothetical protein CAG37_023500 [Serratia nematodiphila]